MKIIIQGFHEYTYIKNFSECCTFFNKNPNQVVKQLGTT